MNDGFSYKAFIAVLITIVSVYALAGFMLWLNKPIEALGLNGVGTGLIGVLGTFKPSTNRGSPIVQTGPDATVNEAKP